MFPGVTNAGDLGEFGYNQMIYTTLSPNRGQYISGGNNFGYPVTPMAFDIAAIQFLYGPNTTFHSGSDGYGLPDEQAPGTTWQCIWDTGGTDTILYDGKKNATIDLRPASLVFGDPIAGGAISKVEGIFGGLTIANGVVIENAAGGSGNDTIRGNSADNIIDGKAGDDTAVFSGNRASYSVQNLGDRIVVSGPDGTDTLFSIEHLKFADATVDPNAPAAPVQPSRWAFAAVADLNGDGTSDIVWHNALKGNSIDAVEDCQRPMGGQRRCRPASVRLAAGRLRRSQWRRHQRPALAQSDDGQRRSLETRRMANGPAVSMSARIRSATRSPESRISTSTARPTCSGTTPRTARPKSGRS